MQKGIVDIVLEQSERMEQLIEDSLALSRLEVTNKARGKTVAQGLRLSYRPFTATPQEVILNESIR